MAAYLETMANRGWDSPLAWAAVAAALVAPLLLWTFISTTARSASKGGRPPQAPYWIPVLGNTVGFAMNTQAFLASRLKRFGQRPFGLLIGLEKMYYVPFGDGVQSMFKNSRSVTSKPLILLGLRDQFGMSSADLQIFRDDESGLNPRPAPGHDGADPSRRIFFLQHRDMHSLLTGTPLSAMTARFVDIFGARIAESAGISGSSSSGGSSGWAELPDLYAFVRHEMFAAATQSLCGEHILRLSPDFASQFWAYDGAMLTYLRRTPRWLARRQYAVRDAARASILQWHTYAADHFDGKAGGDDNHDGDWDPVWGSAIMRVRAETFKRAGISPEGRASLDLGMIWAANANVIPATLWALLNIVLSAELTERVLAEMAPCFDAAGRPDVAALCSKPLLTSIYMEALRLSVATTVARRPVEPVFRLGPWSMERDATLISISWFGAHDGDFWNTGAATADGRPEYPVDAFWAERFLEYPDDPSSGPLAEKARNNSSSSSSSSGKKKKTAEDDVHAKVVTAGIQGRFFPYGGGTSMCPGRFFAKQEMLAALAVLLRTFEIEAVDPAQARRAGPDERYFPVGALPPDRKVPVRIRPRTPRE